MKVTSMGEPALYYGSSSGPDDVLRPSWARGPTYQPGAQPSSSRDLKTMFNFCYLLSSKGAEAIISTGVPDPSESSEGCAWSKAARRGHPCQVQPEHGRRFYAE